MARFIIFCMVKSFITILLDSIPSKCISRRAPSFCFRKKSCSMLSKYSRGKIVPYNLVFLFNVCAKFGNLCNVGAKFEATDYYQKINRSKIKITEKGCCLENNRLSFFLYNFLWSLLGITQGFYLCNVVPTAGTTLHK